MRQQSSQAQPRLSVELGVEVEGDGRIGLRWRAAGAEAELGYQLLVIRSGASPAYTALRLARDLDRYSISGLSRHQRYLCAVLASSASGSACSPWQSVTPKLGLEPRKEPGEGIDALGSHLGRVRRLTVMPQDRRLTAFWERSPGFADEIRLEVLERGRVQKRLTLEPEVASISLDASRGVRLSNGGSYLVRVASSFAGIAGAGESVLCTPAPQGQERAANRAHPQQGLVYPFLDLGPELQVFDDEAPARPATPEAAILCHTCRAPVRWQSYRLICTGCGAEFIPTGRGDYLEASRLRFGTCRCCLPKKILIQRVGSESLACSCSGKEHLRLPGETEPRLIEDLPYGLCQCCRPRRPLLRRGEAVRCSKSDELHRQEGGAWVLAPSQPVFDARAIDDLLDAGLAEICSSGVSRSASSSRSR